MQTYQKKIAEKIINLVTDHKLKSICDYSCGLGEVTKYLSENLPDDVHLIGADFMSRRPEENRPVSSARLKFIDFESKEFQELLFKKGAFDLIFSCDSFHHYEFPVSELQKISSLVRSGGFFLLWDILFSHESDGEILRTTHAFLDEIKMAFAGRYHRHHFTLDQATDYFKATDLKIIEANKLRLDVPEAEKIEENNLKLINIEKTANNLRKNTKNEITREYFLILLDFHKKYFSLYPIDYSAVFFIVAQKP